MWTKDAYQEQMLGYLDEVEAEIRQLAYSRIRRHDILELYADLDVTVEQLWRLIGASDVDWEGFRRPLEISCERLQRAFYRAPRADVMIVSTSRTISRRRSRKAASWKSVEMLG